MVLAVIGNNLGSLFVYIWCEKPGVSFLRGEVCQEPKLFVVLWLLVSWSANIKREVITAVHSFVVYFSYFP